MSKFCRGCGAPLRPELKFCPACGESSQASEQTMPPNFSGISRRTETIEKTDVISDPLEFIKTKVRMTLNSLKQLLKNPKQLIPMAVLSGIWLVLSILSAFRIDPIPVRILSFFTFAQGGMYGGVSGAIGGVIGKAMFAYFVSAFLLPLFLGKNPFRDVKNGFGRLLSGLAVQSAQAAGQLVIGIGIALIVFNFLTGNASLINSMAGVVGFFLALKALLKNGGFIWGLLLSVASKLTNNRIPSQMIISRVTSGYAAGSTLGVVLSALRIQNLPYALGALLLIIGIVISIAVNTKSEVNAA